MVCKSCCQEDKKKKKFKRGLWSPQEDCILRNYVLKYGHGYWSEVPKQTGLQRCGKSCRLRWINYLRPGLKRGTFSQEEQMIIISAHAILGNRWSQIASMLPGRTDNEIKNFWHSHLKKNLNILGIDPNAHRHLADCVAGKEILDCSSTNSTVIPDDLQIISDGDKLDLESSISSFPMELTNPLATLNSASVESETSFGVVEPKPVMECLPDDSSFLGAVFSEWFYSGQNQQSTINAGSDKLQMCPQYTIDSKHLRLIIADCEDPLQKVVSLESSAAALDMVSISSDASKNSLSWDSPNSECSRTSDGSMICNDYSTPLLNTNTISSTEYWEESIMGLGSYSDPNLGIDDNTNLFGDWSFTDMDYY